MDLLHTTPMSFGFVTWPLRPPALSMVLVVKATFEPVHRGHATLAATQRPCHGPIFWDDDPAQSLRLEGDFALLKPAGEVLLAGTCHPPHVPTPVSAVAMGVGPIQKGIGVFGDRHWKGGLLGQASEPAPFEAMPLRWERAFGGPGFEANPLGRGLTKVVEDGAEVLPLPNLELMHAPIVAPNDRPRPAVAFPIAPTWASRVARAGTYDRAWAEVRFPYFPADFDPAFFHAAPEDQRLRQRFWTGTEEVTLRHLVKGRPFIATRLPGLRPRGFVEQRQGDRTRFVEVPLALDTITIDSDAERIYCTWRGSIEVADERLGDIERFFLMHEPVASGRSVEGCRERMEAHLRLRQLEESGFVPVNPEEDDEARTMALERLRKTMAGDPRMKAILDRAAAMSSHARGPDATVMEAPIDDEASAAEPPAPPEDDAMPPPDEVLEGVYADLTAQGLDMTEHRAKLAAIEAGAPPPPVPEPDAIRAAFAASGRPMPDEVNELLEDLEEVRRRVAATDDAPIPETPEGARERFLLAYAEGRPITGDFSGVDLSGEDLSGLVAEGAILLGADLRRAILRDAKLDGAVLARACLEEADLGGASLAGADLTKARLSRARLEGASLVEAILDDAQLVQADLAKADLTKAIGARVDLREAFLEGATLDEADLPQAWLAKAKARGASLVDARLWGAFAEDADFTECDLTTLRAGDGARFDRALFRGAKAEGARFFRASALEANFSFAKLDGADFSGAPLIGATFVGCSLRGARFVGANLYRAAIQTSDLMKADLMDALLDDADLRGSSFFGAELFRARVEGARFELADLSGTKLEGRR